MFEQAFIAAPNARRERTIALALVTQCLLLAGLALLPLIGIEPLRVVQRSLISPPIRGGDPVKERPLRVVSARSSASVRPLFIAPTRVPATITKVDIVELNPQGVSGVLDRAYAGPAGLPEGLPVGEIHVTPPLQPAAAPKSPMRMTSVVAESHLIYGPKPVYPHLAVVSRAEGTVKLQAVISRDGRIENLHVVSGPALLVNAAMEAVKAWRYRPLLLNGEPVEVITEIEVVFVLHR